MYTLYMALHITNPVVEDRVRELAAVTGESITEAIGAAVEERLLKVAPKRKQDQEALLADAYAILREFDALPRYDHRTPDEIIGYDEDGLPT